MDDERKKPSRKAGGHSAGSGKFGRSRDGGAPGKGGKPRFGGKGGKRGFGEGGGKPAFGAKPPGRPFGATAKPATRPGDKSEDRIGGQPAGSDRPLRRPREDSAAAGQAERPVRRGPRPDGKPFRPRGEDEKRPGRYERAQPREGGAAAAGQAERPARRGPRPDGKPFRPRGEDEKRPGRYERAQPREGGAAAAGQAERPVRAEGRPFFKKRDAADTHDEGRPARRFERDHPRGDGDPRHRERSDRPAGAGWGSKRKPFEKHSPDAATPFAAKKTFARRPASAEEADGERIAKRLARVGIASRRDAEELIAAGRVRVNGKVLESPAFNVTAEDVIELDGQPLPPIERTRLFLFHKPVGVVTTSRDPEGRKTVFDVLPADLPRLITVGRLDINTEGLLLLTNDGGLARTLELPATGWLRRYRARVHGKVEESALAGLKDGIAVDGVFYGSIEASLDREQGSNAWLLIGLREGKNREVKNILGSLGLEVTRLIRVSFGPFQLGDLPEGHVQELKGRMLRDQLGERLIEESGANFEAEIVKPFSNKPAKRSEEPAERAAPREARPLRVGEGGLIKNRGRGKEHTREEMLGRLSTRPDRGSDGRKPERGPKPDFGDRPRGKKAGEREQRLIEPPGGRKANVWMASGARPIGAGRAAAEKAAVEAKRARKPAFGKPGGAKSFGKPRGEGRDGGKPGGRPPHSGKPGKGQ